DIVDEVALFQLPRRDVDADRQRGAVRMLLVPHHCLATALVENPSADRLNEPHPFGGGDEALGSDDALVGVVPANQRLEARRSARGELDDRLVAQAQLPSPERPTKVALELDAIQELDVHL